MEKPQFSQCKDCDQIRANDQVINKRCSNCGSSRFVSWPPSEVEQLFHLISSKENAGAFEFRLIASVFTSAAFELLLEKLLVIMAIESLPYEEVGHLTEKLLDSNQGRDRRLQLYSRLGYGSFKSESSELGYPRFYDQWKELAQIRNRLVHGVISEEKELTPSLVKSLWEDGLYVFSGLYNKYIFDTLANKVGREKFEKEKIDLDLLGNWISQKPMTSELLIRKEKSKSYWDHGIYHDEVNWD